MELSLLHKQASLWLAAPTVVKVIATAADISTPVPKEPVTLRPVYSRHGITTSARSRKEAAGHTLPSVPPSRSENWAGPERAGGQKGEAGKGGGPSGGLLSWHLRLQPTWFPDVGGSGGSGNSCSTWAMAEDGPPKQQLDMPLVLDQDLTKQMRLRVESLKQRGEKRQDGEKLLRPAESVYRLDFIQQQKLQFDRWDVVLDKPGKVTITGTSQNWTPDLTNLMTRQLLDPAAIFWRKEDSDVMDWNEADALEFGERLSDLAKIRKVMYFLITFGEGVEPANLKASVVFNQL